MFHSESDISMDRFMILCTEIVTIAIISSQYFFLIQCSISGKKEKVGESCLRPK